MHLPCLARFGAKTLHEVLDVGDFCASFSRGFGFAFQSFGAGSFELRVPAAVHLTLALNEVQRVVRHHIKKTAIVGDDQDGAFVARQVVFEPHRRF